MLAHSGSAVVLVVDDEPLSLRLIATMLASEGYTVLSATNAEGAREQVERCGAAIDLLLVDILMPGTTGLKLAAMLAWMCPSLRVLFMSGLHEEGAVRAGLLEKGMPLLHKPFQRETLAKRVRELLRGSRSLAPDALSF